MAGNASPTKRRKLDSDSFRVLLDTEHLLVLHVPLERVLSLHIGENDEDTEEDIELEYMDVSKHDHPHYADGALASFLSRLVLPMSDSLFLQHCFRKRAVAFCLREDAVSANVERSPKVKINEAVKSRLDLLWSDFSNGDVDQMVYDTASPSIHCWERNKNGDVESRKLEEAKEAIDAYKNGASLYFRSSQDAADKYVEEVVQDLGIDFAGMYASDQTVRGEIEVFASRGGHVTDWHTDFMENFTIQLKGSKRWSLMKPNIPHTLRGLTPHFADTGNADEQLKAARLDNPDVERNPPPSFFEHCGTVTLSAGDVLYFPGGAWHRVETPKKADNTANNSLSINLSIVAQTWADVIADSVRQVLWRDRTCREMVQVNALNPLVTMKKIQDMLRTTVAAVSNLRPGDMCPPGKLLSSESLVGDVFDVNGTESSLSPEWSELSPDLKCSVSLILGGGDKAQKCIRTGENGREELDMSVVFEKLKTIQLELNPMAVIFPESDLPESDRGTYEGLMSFSGPAKSEGESARSEPHADSADENDGDVSGDDDDSFGDGSVSEASWEAPKEVYADASTNPEVFPQVAYRVNCHFGNEDFTSSIHAVILVPNELAPVVDMLCRKCCGAAPLHERVPFSFSDAMNILQSRGGVKGSQWNLCSLMLSLVRKGVLSLLSV